MQHRKDYGQYLRNLFFIELNTDINSFCRVGNEENEQYLLTRLPKEDFATFVHEYMHFLLNITTTSGLNRFNMYSKYLQLYIYTAYEKYDDEILCPIFLEDTGVDNAAEAADVNSFYYGMGANGSKKIHHINKITLEKEEIIQDNLPAGTVNICIYYDDKTTPYYFGADCIEESIAYLVESEKFGAKKRNNELPYNACELVTKYFCKKIVDQKNIIVTLAELSLLHYHPGQMFVEFLKHIETNDKVFHNSRGLIDYYKETIEVHLQNYGKEITESEECIDFMYPQFEPFERINIWLKEVRDKGKEQRKEKLALIGPMIELPENKCKLYLYELIKIMGYPAISDNNHMIYSSEENISLVLVPGAIREAFNGKKKCFMYEYCIANNMSQISDLCLEEPWSQNTQCPFSLFWQHYSLSDKKIISRN